jgi:uncharacterized protein (TIGR02271 family)
VREVDWFSMTSRALQRRRLDTEQGGYMADNFTTNTLQRLSDADFKVADNEPDVRGWTVVASDGDELGQVDDLIIDTTARKVRYLEIEPDAAHRSAGAEALYVPVQQADVRRDPKRVVLRGTAQAMRSLVPADFSRQFDVRRDDKGEAQASRPAVGTDEVKRMTRAEEEVQVSKRPVKAGEVRVGKHVETEHVRENVNVSRDEVHVERHPVSDSRTAAEIRASESEIRVPVVEEEIVVEKRPIVKEEVIVGKERVEETRPVDVEKRKEEIDIHDDRAPGDRSRTRGER